MPATLIIAGLMFAQAAAPTITVQSAPTRFEVGYRELADNRPAAAIERIAANRALDADDPAAQINRGTALARLGTHDAAIAHYRSAILSRERCDLELADGTWMDSRAAARMAIKMVARGEALALR